MAVYLLSMLSVKYDGKTYDAMALAVDRHSGWMVGYPPRKKGLTGEQVATKMFEKGGWDVMGIPSYGTSDPGPHFISIQLVANHVRPHGCTPCHGGGLKPSGEWKCRNSRTASPALPERNTS